MMDINTLRSLATLLGFVAFLLLVWHVWRRVAPAEHARAAALPFADEGADTGSEEVRRG